MKEPIIITIFAVAGSTGSELIETHGLSLSTAFAVATVVLPAAWWLSRKLQRLDDRIDGVEKKIDALPCIKPKDCHYE